MLEPYTCLGATLSKICMIEIVKILKIIILQEFYSHNFENFLSFGLKLVNLAEILCHHRHPPNALFSGEISKIFNIIGIK
jgi:hypothetical protein